MRALVFFSFSLFCGGENGLGAKMEKKKCKRAPIPPPGRERENVWRETTRVSREVYARERSSVLASRGFFPRGVVGARADILFSQFFFRPIHLSRHTHPWEGRRRRKN